MRRREFMTFVGGAVAAWPLVASAQQAGRMRRVGTLLNASSDDPQYQAWVGAFLQERALLGWAVGRNMRMDMRWAGPNITEIRRHAAELATLAPDVILAHGAGPVGTLLQATRTVPIVFPVVVDPVGGGFVDSLDRYPARGGEFPDGPQLGCARKTRTGTTVDVGVFAAMLTGKVVNHRQHLGVAGAATGGSRSKPDCPAI